MNWILIITFTWLLIFNLYAALRTSVYGIGKNQVGQLGYRQVESIFPFNGSIRVPFTNVPTFKKMGGKSFNTIFLDKNDQLWGQGANSVGLFGLGHNHAILKLTKVYEGKRVLDFASGGSYMLVVDSNHDIYVSGENLSGELGYTENKYSLMRPLRTFKSNETVQAQFIETGNRRSLFIDKKYRVYGTGNNKGGVLGLGNGITEVYNWTYVTQDVKQVSVGFSHTLFLKIDGNVYGVGDNYYGSLGTYPRNYQQYEFIRMNVTQTIVQIAAINSKSVVLDDQGNVFVTGSNENYQLGLNESPSFVTFRPWQLDFGIPIKRIAEGTGKVGAAVDIHGQVHVWGYNQVGNLGIGGIPDKDRIKVEPAYAPQPVILEGMLTGENITHVHLDSGFSLFLDELGRYYFSGFGSTNLPTFGDIHQQFTLRPSHKHQLSSVKTSDEHALFLDAFGVVYTTGSNEQGQLGDGTTISRDHIEPIILNTSIQEIGVGKEFSLLLSFDGHLYKTGKFGNDTMHEPTRVPMPENHVIVEMATGEDHALFLTDVGTVYSMGSNTFGQLGIVEQSYREYLPTLVSDEGDLHGLVPVYIFAGHETSFVIDIKGKVLSCGHNIFGVIGQGYLSPRIFMEMDRSDISGSPTFQSISSRTHTLLLDQSGKVFGTGTTSMMELGSMDKSEVRRPTLLRSIPSDFIVYRIAAGFKFSVFGLNNGSMYIMGTFLEQQFNSLTSLNGMFPSMCNTITASHDMLMGICFSETNSNLLEYCPNGQHNEDGLCLPCPAGFSCHHNLKTKCKVGYYSMGQGKTQCQYCKEGHYGLHGQGESHEVCIPCSFGFYNNETGQSTCKPCEKGSYQDQTGQHECVKCAKGRYSQEIGAIVRSYCEQCDVGHYCPLEGMVSPTPCPAGMYLDKFGSDNVTHCKQCADGYLCPAGTGFEPSKPCPLGTYLHQEEAMDPTCAHCPAGYFCRDGIKYPCKIGYYSSERSSSCLPCHAGYFCDGLAINGTQYPCPAGSFCPMASHRGNISACHPGTFSEAKYGACSLCEAGFYSNGWNQSACEPCTIPCRVGSALDVSFKEIFNNTVDTQGILWDTSHETPDNSNNRLIGVLTTVALCVLLSIFLMVMSIISHHLFKRLKLLTLLDIFKSNHYTPLNQSPTYRKTAFGGFVSVIYVCATLCVWIILLLFFFVSNVKRSTSFEITDGQRISQYKTTLMVTQDFIKPPSVSLERTSLVDKGLHYRDSQVLLEETKHHHFHRFNSSFVHVNFSSFSPSLSFGWSCDAPLSFIRYNLTIITHTEKENKSFTLMYTQNTEEEKMLCGVSDLRIGIDLHRYEQLPSFFSKTYFASLIDSRAVIDHEYFMLKLLQFDGDFSCSYRSDTSYSFITHVHYTLNDDITVTTESYNISLFSLISYLFSMLGTVAAACSFFLVFGEQQLPKFKKYISHFFTKKQPIERPVLNQPFLDEQELLEDVDNVELNHRPSSSSEHLQQLQLEVERLSKVISSLQEDSL